MGATSGTGTAYPSGEPKFTPVFRGVRVTRSLVLCVCLDSCLSFCTFSFDHCFVCSSSIYGFWLPLWYLQTLLSLTVFEAIVKGVYCTIYSFWYRPWIECDEHWVFGLKCWHFCHKEIECIFCIDLTD